MIYIDEEIPWPKLPHWPYGSVTHFFASHKDDMQELHNIAKFIGLKRSWFQHDSQMPHYDLNHNKRAKAISAGVQQCTSEEFLAAMRYWRVQSKIITDLTGVSLKISQS